MSRPVDEHRIQLYDLNHPQERPHGDEDVPPRLARADDDEPAAARRLPCDRAVAAPSPPACAACGGADAEAFLASTAASQSEGGSFVIVSQSENQGAGDVDARAVVTNSVVPGAGLDCALPEPVASRDTTPADDGAVAGDCVAFLLRLVARADEHLPLLARGASDRDPVDADGPAPRQRDVFPLMHIAPCRGYDHIARGLANGVVDGLNSLYGVTSPHGARAPSAAQVAVHERLLEHVSRFVGRLARARAYPSGAATLTDLAATESKSAPDGLKAASVDVLDGSSRVDPLPFVPGGVRSLLTPRGLFGDAPAGLDQFPSIRGPARGEYIKLVLRQLRAEKLELRTSVLGGGTIFGVAKTGSVKVREVWHGSRVSEAAAAPPLPPDLAGPAALVDLECTAADPLRLTKRDGRCLFDQLQLSRSLRPYMGRPPLLVRELRAAGATGAELKLWCRGFRCCGDGLRIFPVSRCWAMGFSWSSYIAQCLTLNGICRAAGLWSPAVLSLERPTPLDFSETFAVATDDIMVFNRGPLGKLGALGPRIDKAMIDLGVVKNASKDINGVGDEVCIGVALEGGVRFAPPPDKLAYALAGVAEVLAVGAVTPHSLQSLLGVVQWFDQINRPLFAVLDTVYEFQRRLPTHEVQQLDACHLRELLVVMLLAPLWEADLTRPWLSELLASDASTSFGFGASALRCSSEVTRSVGRLSEKRGDYIRFARDGGPDDEPERDRIGTPHKLGFAKSAFRTLFSIEAKTPASPGELEAIALVMTARWVTRARHNHGHRVVILVDAKAVLGAAAKGRSSAPSIRPHMQRLAALSLATGLLLRFVYIPSEDNPADAPSRGPLKLPDRARL